MYTRFIINFIQYIFSYKFIISYQRSNKDISYLLSKYKIIRVNFIYDCHDEYQ